jgi:hypothetical protein
MVKSKVCFVSGSETPDFIYNVSGLLENKALISITGYKPSNLILGATKYVCSV